MVCARVNCFIFIFTCGFLLEVNIFDQVNSVSGTPAVDSMSNVEYAMFIAIKGIDAYTV